MKMYKEYLLEFSLFRSESNTAVKKLDNYLYDKMNKEMDVGLNKCSGNKNFKLCQRLLWVKVYSKWYNILKSKGTNICKNDKLCTKTLNRRLNNLMSTVNSAKQDIDQIKKGKVVND